MIVKKKRSLLPKKKQQIQFYFLGFCIHIYIYIYVYTYRERKEGFCGEAMSAAGGGEEDKKPADQSAAHINLKVKGQVFPSNRFAFFFFALALFGCRENM